MKLTKSIQIAQLPYFIEEDGFEVLGSYLDSINRHFSSEDAAELTVDVELRIVELLEEKSIHRGDVITVDAITQIISQIGEIADTSDDGNTIVENVDASNLTDVSNTKLKKKLFRDSKRGSAMGVCQGLSEYLSIDATIFRLFFASGIASVFVGSFLSAILGADEFFGLGIGWSVGIISLYFLLAFIIPDVKTEFDRALMRGANPSIGEVQKSFSSDASLEELKSTTVAGEFVKKSMFFAINTIKIASKVSGYLLLAFFTVLIGLGLLSFVWIVSLRNQTISEYLPVGLFTIDRVIIATNIAIGIFWFLALSFLVYSLLRKKPKLLKKTLLIGLFLVLVSSVAFPLGIYRSVRYAERANDSENKEFKYRFAANEQSDLTIEIGKNAQVSLNESKNNELSVTSTASDRFAKKDRVQYDKNQSKISVRSASDRDICKFCTGTQYVEIFVPSNASTITLKRVSNEDSVADNSSEETTDVEAVSVYTALANNRKIILEDNLSLSLFSFAQEDSEPYSAFLNLDVSIGKNATDNQSSIFTLGSIIYSANLKNIEVESSVGFGNDCFDCVSGGETRNAIPLPEKAESVSYTAPNLEDSCFYYPPNYGEDGMSQSIMEPATYELKMNGKILAKEEIRQRLCQPIGS